MNTHKLTIAIGGIFAFILIIGGVFAIKYSHQNLQQKEVYTAELPVPPEYLEQKTEPVIETRPISEWEKLSDQDIVTIAGKDLTEFCYTEMPLRFSQEIDLTGDGKPEGLFGCGAGNGNAYALFIKDSDKISIAKVKSKDGTIGSVSFFQKGTVMYTSGFKLLPEQNAFYDYGNSYNNDTGRFDCSEVNTYKWNSKTQLFEWNIELTKSYTKIYQDNECQWEDEK